MHRRAWSHDDTLGRALDMLYDYGLTELYSLMAATAAQRLGLAPTFAHLESTSLHVDGRDNSAEEPDTEVIHITRGDSRDHRPDLNHVMLDLMVEHQAGIPLLMKPLSGNSSDVQDVGQVVTEHIHQLQTTYGTTDLVADSALYSEQNLQKLGETGITWITRVPATVSEAPVLLTETDPQTMALLLEGYHYQTWMSTSGRVPQRWGLCYSEARRPQAQRLVNQHWLKQSEAEAKALQQLCRTAYACAADAQHALPTFAQGLQATALREGPVHPMPRYRMRGRPSHDTPPARVVCHITGALASSLAAHEALVAPHSCFILATNELDDRP